jgi:hypothetical protein
LLKAIFPQPHFLGNSPSQPNFCNRADHLLQAPLAVPLDKWTHLAASYDGSTKRLYVNGEQVTSHDEFGALVYDPAPVPVAIGSDWQFNASDARFNGRIDEVALYNRALTPDEILSSYTADFAGKDLSRPYFTSPAELPDAGLGVSYTQQLTTILGTSPVSFSLSGGVLPLGMTLSSAGVMSGLSSSAGIFTFTVRATDAAGITSEQVCTLQVV